MSVWEVTVATIARVAVVPLARDPTVHVPDAYEPCDGVDDTSVSPAGRLSATDTLVAVSAPLFTTETVNVTLELIAGVALLTLFVTRRSESRTSTEALAVLFAEFGSYVVDATDAEFVMFVSTVGVAVIVTDAAPPDGMAASVQVTTPADSEHPADADTKVKPAGSVSVTVGATAVEGPLLVTVTVYVRFCKFRYGPDAGVVTALAIARSATGRTVTVTPPELFAALSSSSVAPAVAVFDSEPVAAGVTTRVTVAEPFFAIEPRPQLTTPAKSVHSPCDGVTEPKVTPAGRVSLNVTLVAPLGPAFATVMV